MVRILILGTLNSKCAYTIFKNECSQFKNCVSYKRTRNIKLHTYIYTYLTFSSPHFGLILRTINSKCAYTFFKNECSQFKNCVSYNRTRNVIHMSNSPSQL